MTIDKVSSTHIYLLNIFQTDEYKSFIRIRYNADIYVFANE